MAMLSYHDEDGIAAIPEMKALFEKHYDELCVTKEFPLNPNYEVYERLAATGQLRFISCRIDGEIIGYIVFLVQPHLHYKDCLTAFEDIYFIEKEYRRGRIGIKLFQYAEQVLKGIGVNRIIMHTKVHLDNSRLFEYLGYKNSDKMFTKVFA